MHAKVYLTDVGAVVGSANLSAKALSEIEQNGQDEAAVFLKDKFSRDTIDKWFRALWDAPGTREIAKDDLDRADKAYRKAHKAKLTGGKAKNQTYRSVQSLSTASRRQLAELARIVRDQDIATEIGFSLEEVKPQAADTTFTSTTTKIIPLWLLEEFRGPSPFLTPAQARSFSCGAPRCRAIHDGPPRRPALRKRPKFGGLLASITDVFLLRQTDPFSLRR
jgi:hypothetical protein